MISFDFQPVLVGAALTPRLVDAPIVGRTISHVVYAIDRATIADGPLPAGRTAQ